MQVRAPLPSSSGLEPVTTRNPALALDAAVPTPRVKLDGHALDGPGRAALIDDTWEDADTKTADMKRPPAEPEPSRSAVEADVEAAVARAVAPLLQAIRGLEARIDVLEQRALYHVPGPDSITRPVEVPARPDGAATGGFTESADSVTRPMPLPAPKPARPAAALANAEPVRLTEPSPIAVPVDVPVASPPVPPVVVAAPARNLHDPFAAAMAREAPARPAPAPAVVVQRRASSHPQFSPVAPPVDLAAIERSVALDPGEVMFDGRRRQRRLKIAALVALVLILGGALAALGLSYLNPHAS